MIYLIVIAYIVILNFNFPKLNSNKSIVAYNSILILLVLIAGFRYNVGSDTIAYTYNFKYVPNINDLNSEYINTSLYQPLWVIFTSIVKSFTDSFYIVQIVLAVFVNYTVFSFIKKYSENPILTVLLYFILFYPNLNMEILRESVPVCLLLIGIEMLEEKKYWRYYLLALIGFFFHQSGVILFFVPFVHFIKGNRMIYMIYIISVFFLSKTISVVFVDYLSTMDNLFVSSKISYFDDQDVSVGTFYFQIIKFILFPSSILLLFFKKLNRTEKNLLLLYIVFSTFYLNFFIFYRIRDYFYLPFILIFINGLYRYRNDIYKHNIVKVLALVLFLSISLFRYYYSSKTHENDQLYLNYYPYNSILNEDIPLSRLNKRDYGFM